MNAWDNTLPLLAILMRYFSISIILLNFCSCNRTENKDFEEHSDCIVFNDEVKTESYSFGQVAFIDTGKSSGCAKEQLKNVYLLYYDTICVAVHNQHPKNDFKTIELFIKQFQTDTTRLSDLVRFDSTLRVTVDRLCKDTSDQVHNGRYVRWRNMEYSTLTQPYQKTKDEVVQTWYKWAN